MRYLEKTFTVPAGPSGISQRQWDYATLTSAEFAKKYAEESVQCTSSDTQAGSDGASVVRSDQ